MFTGIIEELGKVVNLEKENQNLHISISCPFVSELSIDQSIAHNGICLTVVDITSDYYTVTAIKETMERTNLGKLNKGDLVNLERCIKLSDRLDGHIVQGHVDQVGTLTEIVDQKGSYLLRFSYREQKFVTVEKGSICVNGISLTVVDSLPGEFSVAIIPYTWENTNLHRLKTGDKVNLEFDILGKYVEKLINK